MGIMLILLPVRGADQGEVDSPDGAQDQQVGEPQLEPAHHSSHVNLYSFVLCYNYRHLINFRSLLLTHLLVVLGKVDLQY